MREEEAATNTPQTAARFSDSAIPFVEKLVNENRALFERLA
ncbi:MAG TPA: hypothetical protein VFD70_09445 [Anaerolineae bacterium]|nr:hypothetical protein [Anaerolineae bacterium]